MDLFCRDDPRPALAEVVKEMKGIAGARAITAEELAFAKKSETLSLAGRWETSEAVAGSIGEIVAYGLDDRYFDTYASRVAALNLADAADAGRMVQADRMVYVVVGDRSKIEAGIRELNLGPLKSVDADGNPLP